MSSAVIAAFSRWYEACGIRRREAYRIPNTCGEFIDRPYEILVVFQDLPNVKLPLFDPEYSGEYG